jgi:hypothetical protein
MQQQFETAKMESNVTLKSCMYATLQKAAKNSEQLNYRNKNNSSVEARGKSRRPTTENQSRIFWT